MKRLLTLSLLALGAQSGRGVEIPLNADNVVRTTHQAGTLAERVVFNSDGTMTVKTVAAFGVPTTKWSDLASISDINSQWTYQIDATGFPYGNNQYCNLYTNVDTSAQKWGDGGTTGEHGSLRISLWRSPTDNINVDQGWDVTTCGGTSQGPCALGSEMFSAAHPKSYSFRWERLQSGKLKFQFLTAPGTSASAGGNTIQVEAISKNVVTFNNGAGVVPVSMYCQYLEGTVGRVTILNNAIAAPTTTTPTTAAPTTAEPTTAAPTTAATTTTCQPSDCADESLVPKDNLATIKCKGASCTPTECCVCGLRHWGFDIPFAKNKGITVTGDDLSSGKLQMTFSLETQACVDRASQLSLSFRDTEPPVCQGKLASDNVACASKAAGGKSGCEQDGKCRYRVTCKKDDLVLTDVFDVRKSLAAGSQKRTDYVIDIRTNLLASKGKDIYTAPSASNPVTTLEVCVRPTVKRTGNTEVLFREVVALVEMDTTGGFSLTIEADSRDDTLEDSVDLDVDADAFACEKKGVAYERASPKALTPNSLLTLCVVGKMASFKCNNIAELTFEQTTGMSKYSEIRVSGYQARDLTNKYPNVDVKTSSSTTVKGCVVDARLGSVFFAGLNPANVVVSGKALLDFVPTGGRKLRGQSSESAAVMVRFGDRKLQDQEVDEGEISSFGAEFELSNSNNDDVDFATMPIQGIAAGCVAVTTMLFTV